MKFRLMALGFALSCSVAVAQTQSQTQTQTRPPVRTAPPAAEPTPPAPKPDTTPVRGKVLEEIVARVNNSIITSIDLERAKTELANEVKQDCATNHCTQDEFNKIITDKEKDVLRNLIDRELLIQRAKDLNISVESDLVKELDDIRLKNNLPDLDALEKAVTSEGISYDEFKNNLRSSLLTQEVISREIYSRLGSSVDHAELVKYYEEHKSEFTAPESVFLREILVSTDGKPEADLPALKKKAEELRTRVLNGEDFGELAKHFSDGSTGKQGGELGKFERGALSKTIEDAVFTLNRKEMTPVMTTPKGYLLIQVEQRYEAGIQPMEKVEGEIMNQLASKLLEPKLRTYLDTLRKDSFVDVRPGFTDTGGVADTTSISEVRGPGEETTAKKQSSTKKHKRFLIF
jgi:peptidyl-prolyl cis-trans isomerase SurA